MKKRIEKYFPAAMNAIDTVFPKTKGEIAKEFQGYISAFGSAVLQMGLMPTLAVHADEGSGAAQDKRLLLQVLALTLTHTNGVLSSAAQQSLKGKEKELFKIAVQGNQDLRQELREHLLDAAVAVKLCLRTYKLTSA